MLAAATGTSVLASPSATGTSAGTALLFHDGGPIPLPEPVTAPPLENAAGYTRRWNAIAHGK